MSESDASADARRIRVYTKTGDKGTSQLYNMQRISKTSSYFEALGDVDELNAFVGVAREHCAAAGNGVDEQLDNIQSRLLDLGSCVATPLTSSPESRIHRTKFDAGVVDVVERWIDAMDDALPPLTQFILPSGGHAAAALHVCRTVCRRAERKAVALVDAGDLEPAAGRFLNRLSDYFFVAARFAAHKEGKPEVTYKKPVERFHSHLRADGKGEEAADATDAAAAAAKKE